MQSVIRNKAITAVVNAIAIGALGKEVKVIEF
jgi:hypothetical protein